MGPRHYKCIEAMIAYPDLSYEKLAELVGCNRNTITEWRRNEIFMNAYHERLREVWKDAEGIAVNTMINLAKEGDFKASKYILDSQGYAPAQKVEAKVDATAQVVIVDDLGDEHHDCDSE